MIQLNNIHKSFNDLEVIKGVDLTIESGSITSIMGASGAGKSTLLQMMGTLDIPDSGSVLFDGVEVTNLSKKDLAKFRNKNIGFIFQFHHLLPEFTAMENVAMPGYIATNNKGASEERATGLLKKMGLGNRLNHKPNELSGGEQQRVAIARALMNKPKVILADEPSGNLDSKNARELHELFLMLRDEYNQTFVIVTHNEELAKYGDRLLYMEDGNITDRY